MKKNRLSVTIITLNEQENLVKCLESVKNIADEVIIVDSGSTDKTVEIAKKFGAKVYFRKFDDYASQKNFALSKVMGDWILALDADEIVTNELKEEIQKLIKTSELDAYSIPRKNYILGKFIKHTRWQPELDRHIWLWKKDKGGWVGKVHEEVVVNCKVGRIRNPKIHYQDKTIGEFIRKLNTYSEIEAEELIDKGFKFSYFRLFLDPIYEFFVRFFYRLGFLDGWRGFVLSYLMAIYRLITWIKVWQKESVSKDN